MSCLLVNSLKYCNYSAGGVNRILFANSNQITQHYFASGSTSRTIVTSLATANTYTQFFEFSFDKTQTSVIETMDKNENGKLFVKRIEIVFTRMDETKRTVLNQLLNSKLIAIYLDYNERWWIVGEDQPLRVIEWEETSSDIAGVNQYRLVLESSGKYTVRRIDTNYAFALAVAANSGNTQAEEVEEDLGPGGID